MVCAMILRWHSRRACRCKEASVITTMGCDESSGCVETRFPTMPPYLAPNHHGGCATAHEADASHVSWHVTGSNARLVPDVLDRGYSRIFPRMSLKSSALVYSGVGTLIWSLHHGRSSFVCHPIIGWIEHHLFTSTWRGHKVERVSRALTVYTLCRSWLPRIWRPRVAPPLP